MGFFDFVFQEMPLDELVLRLPGEGALQEFTKRLDKNLLVEFFSLYESKEALRHKKVKDLLANFIDEVGPLEVVKGINQKFYSFISVCLSPAAKDYLLSEPETPIEIYYNLGKKYDSDHIQNTINRLLSEKEINPVKLGSMINRFNHSHIQSQYNKLMDIEDDRVVLANLIIQERDHFKRCSKLVEKAFEIFSIKDLYLLIDVPFAANLSDFVKTTNPGQGIQRFFNLFEKSPQGIIPFGDVTSENDFLLQLEKNDISIDGLIEQYKKIVGTDNA